MVTIHPYDLRKKDSGTTITASDVANATTDRWRAIKLAVLHGFAIATPALAAIFVTVHLTFERVGLETVTTNRNKSTVPYNESNDDHYTFIAMQWAAMGLMWIGVISAIIIVKVRDSEQKMAKEANQKLDRVIESFRQTEDILHSMLPKSVAQKIRDKEPVLPKNFECVTVMFSDIVRFTEICAIISPIEVVTMLNELYHLFDSIIEQYDVYKVETIGDCYMISSGVPTRNGDRHATEIARVALRFIQSIRKIKVPRKNRSLQIRAGMHSGPVVGGVVGTKMPHYCLFGDTVNTASRMESSGEAMKIHISEATAFLLNRTGLFKLKQRGEIVLKGKGSMMCYWLHEGVDAADDTRVLPEEPTTQNHVDPLFCEYVSKGASHY